MRERLRFFFKKRTTLFKSWTFCVWRLGYYFNKVTFLFSFCWRNTIKFTIDKGKTAISIEVRPLAALYHIPYNFLDWCNRKGENAVGMIIPPPATTKSGYRGRRSRSKPYKANFFMGGGGYKAARGPISRHITRKK